MLACANVANLQVARAIARRREIAVRLALGAGRGRVLRQMLVENLLLAGVAAIVGAAIASWAPARIVEFIANETRGLTIRFDNDVRVITFIAAVTILAALMSGFAPAWNAVRDSVTPGLREGGGSRGATSRGRLRRFLLAAQVALSAILVSGTALMVRVADRTRHADPGFSYENVINVNLGLGSTGLSDEQVRPVAADLETRIAALPGVEAVAHSIAVPLGDTNMGWGIRDSQGNRVVIGIDRVSANLLDTLRIPLLAGRPFRSEDEARAEYAIVNKAAAERLWPGESPIGKPMESGSKTIIIGVAANITTRNFGSEQSPYAWVVERPSRGSRILIRHAPGARDAILAALPAIARQQDRRILVSAAPLSDNIVNGQRSANIAAGIAAFLGSLALLLACVGIYGVAAYNVSQRTREIGVRIALGARPAMILTLVLQQNLRTVLLGAAVGVAGAIGFAQLLKTLLFGLSPVDPIALSSTILILITTALLATWAPARRAAAIDPAITLRQD
jgi:predicted permease